LKTDFRKTTDFQLQVDLTHFNVREMYYVSVLFVVIL